MLMKQPFLLQPKFLLDTDSFSGQIEKEVHILNMPDH